MEHLPVPIDCSQDVQPFEYYQTCARYDRNGFAGFLERTGYSESQLAIDIKSTARAYQPNASKEESIARAKGLAGVLQEWCWFGLLHELELLCGTPMNTSALVSQSHTEPSFKILSTASLPDYVSQIRQSKGKSITGPAQLEDIGAGNRLVNCIKTIEGLTSDIGSTHLVHPISPTFSFICLLTEAVLNIVEKGLGYKSHRPWRHPFPAPQNWCPSRRNYFAMVERPGLKAITNLLPSFAGRREKHRKLCTRTRCDFYPYKTSLVEPQHTSECNGTECIPCPVSTEILVDILSRGGNPGFHVASFEHRTISVEDVSGKNYVAISHVWAHGLGNASENALPWCQVYKIAGLVAELCGPSAAIWIDTLSVPANPEHKHLAITKLRKVYRDAQAVLVLDKHLQQVESDRFGRSLQLLGSEWMTRLWTLQEGKLARKLFVRFSDVSVPISELLDPFAGQSLVDGKLMFIDAEIIQGLLQDLFTDHEDVTRRILQLVISLCNRNVSVPTDEPICLATLLGLNLEDFAAIPTMADVYRAFSNDLPEDIAFCGGDRLKEPGLRWAPASLLNQAKIRVWTYGKAKLTARGLCMEKDLIRLDSNPDIESSLAGNSWYSLPSIINNEPLAFAVGSLPCRPLPAMHRAALILHTPRNSDPASSRAILVEIIGEEDDTVFCRFLANAQTARGKRIAFASRCLWGTHGHQTAMGSLQASRQICID